MYCIKDSYQTEAIIYLDLIDRKHLFARYVIKCRCLT